MNKRVAVVIVIILFLSGNQLHAQNIVKPKVTSLQLPKFGKPLPPDFYATQLGFFCTKELQIQKATRTNIFFRLGTKDYVDVLERKPNARIH